MRTAEVAVNSSMIQYMHTFIYILIYNAPDQSWECG